MSISADASLRNVIEHVSLSDVMLERSPDAIVHISAGGQVARMNSPARILANAEVGLAEVGLRVEHVIQALYPDDMPSVLASVLTSSTSRRVESRHLRDDMTYWLETWIVPLDDENGHSVVTFGRDITHLKQTEERLRLEAVEIHSPAC
jgi:PAS domain S-box-containing protein